MDELKNFNIHDLFRVIKKNDNDFLQWLAEKKLIWTTRNCECGKQMVKINQNKSAWPIWRCNQRTNHGGKMPTKGFFDGTFFSGSHLTPKQVIEFTYYWCRDTHTQAEFQFDMGLSTKTIVDWKMFCRDVAASYFLNHPEKIGGISKTVEIDETVLCKPKYHRGREVAKEQQWFFRGLCG
uniref:Uncharacterized protein n=1 Tax=Meloidogyne enterolobii TaxID=390850 RepID=A0A6V7WRJ6_MELEN|nr:unnamed protein product [Meloidogyne enterolobii]